jgi:threonine aldolase
MDDKLATINLRSDTQSLPNAEMRQAMARAELGDETYFEDPTVRRLEDRVAELTGHEAAMLTISGTMANLVAVMTHCSPGDEVLVPHEAHILTSEAAGITRIAGVLPTVGATDRGHLTVEGVRQSTYVGDVMRPSTRLVWIENTHNRAGGSVLGPEAHDAIVDAAHAGGLSVHLDGARLPNAAVARGVPLARLARGADSVYLDFTKGLACPLGAALAGSVEFVAQARHNRRVLGGGMRQAGVIAAAALVALDTCLPRLADDHQVARQIATELAASEYFQVDLDQVETNFVLVSTHALGPADEVAAQLAAAGLLVSTRPPFQLRLVTYSAIDPRVASEAVRRMNSVAAAMNGVGRSA